MSTGKRTDEQQIKVHFNRIPAYVVRTLVEPLASPLDAFFAEPGRREKYEQWLAERNVRQAIR